jgi:FkbM family methyltransferase
MTAASGKVRRLALVRLDRIGDFLLWLPTARGYRRHFADAEIVLFCNEIVADLARLLPYWDEVAPVPVPSADAPSLPAGGRRRAPFDLVVNTQYSRTAAHDRFVAALPAKRAVAVAARGPNMTEPEHAECNARYAELLAVDAAPRHEVSRNFEILRAVTGTAEAASLEPLARFLPPIGRELPAQYVAIFPSTSWHKKAYPWPRIAHACRFLMERFGLPSVLCGGAEDRIVGANIHRNADGATVDLIGAFDLPQSLGVIAGAQLVIANDSLAAHAANFLGTPSVCILGGGYNTLPTAEAASVGRFFPYPADLVSPDLQTVLSHPIQCQGCSYLCKYDAVVRDCIPCIDYIPLPSLLDAADRMLGEAFLARARGVIHVGANTGQERASYASRGLRVLWIEPIPLVFDELLANIAALPGQIAARALVTDVDDRPELLHISNNHGASSSILPLGRHREIWPEVDFVDEIAVASITLPSLLRREGLAGEDYDVLVIDTQGTEELVLAGAEPMLRNFAWIRTEAADFESYIGCTTVDRLVEFLRPRGFALYSQRKFAQAPAGGSYYDLLFRRVAEP